jgi:rhodanese-related sulfurtransferase
MALAEGRKTLLGLGEVEKAAWVDPRGGRAYREGHIPGALHVPFQDLNDQQETLRGYNALIVYGSDFQDNLADAMSKRLLELGFKDVRTLKGGLRAWTRAGYEVETGDSATGIAP